MNTTENILASIDNISNVKEYSDINTCITLLEYYSKLDQLSEYGRSEVFQEADESSTDTKKQSIGGKIKNVCKKIIDAIVNLFNKTIGKLFNKVKDVEQGTTAEISKGIEGIKKKVTKKSHKSLLDKMKSFRDKHPIVLTIGTTAALGGAIYGGSKALDAYGKHKAINDLSYGEKTYIENHFNAETEELSVDFNIQMLYNSIDLCYNEYKMIVDTILNDIKFENEETGIVSKDSADNFMKSGKLKNVFNRIYDVDSKITESGFRGKTSIKDGAKGWNKFMEKFSNTIGHADEANVYCSEASRLIYSIISAADPSLQDPSINQIYPYINKHANVMREALEVEQSISDYAASFTAFFNSYYAIQQRIAEIKKGILKAMEIAARLVSVALSDPDENARNEITKLRAEENRLNTECRTLKKDVDNLSNKRKYLTKDIEDLEKKKDELREKCKQLKIEAPSNDTSSSNDTTKKKDETPKETEKEKNDEASNKSTEVKQDNTKVEEKSKEEKKTSSPSRKPLTTEELYAKVEAMRNNPNGNPFRDYDSQAGHLTLATKTKENAYWITDDTRIVLPNVTETERQRSKPSMFNPNVFEVEVVDGKKISSLDDCMIIPAIRSDKGNKDEIAEKGRVYKKK